MNFTEAYNKLLHITTMNEATITNNKNALIKYDRYIKKHKQNVMKSFIWLLDNLPELFNQIDINEFKTIIENHDNSKYTKEEFEPYAIWWSGDIDLEDNEDEYYEALDNYNKAWEHHIKYNKHHPEYWDGKDMPYIYVLEMICDWMSFSFLHNNNMNELIDYYKNEAREDDEKNLSTRTKKLLDDIILNKIANKI